MDLPLMLSHIRLAGEGITTFLSINYKLAEVFLELDMALHVGGYLMSSLVDLVRVLRLATTVLPLAFQASVLEGLPTDVFVLDVSVE